MAVKAYFRTDTLETLAVVEVVEGVSDEQIKVNNCESAFEAGTFDPDIIDCVELTDDEIIEWNKGLRKVTVTDADGTHTVDTTDDSDDLETKLLDGKKSRLYGLLYHLKGAKTEMEADSRDTTAVEAEIAEVESQITDLYA